MQKALENVELAILTVCVACVKLATLSYTRAGFLPISDYQFLSINNQEKRRGENEKYLFFQRKPKIEN